MNKREKMSEKKSKIIEIICIIGLIIFAIVVHFITRYVNNNKNSDRDKNIFITKNGKEITEIDGVKIDINVDGTYKIESANGEYNIIEIKDKKIKCIEANCPDGICEKHGYLRDDIDNDMIICAPHGLIIEYNK